jgi:hypothetical protein
MHFYDEIKSSFIIIIFLSYIFLVSGLIVNFFQLCSCIIWPFNKALFRKINCYLALGLWSREYYYYHFMRTLFASAIDNRDIIRKVCIFGIFIILKTKNNIWLFISIIELTFLGQWWSKSDIVLYIKPDDLHSISNEHMIAM